MACTMPHFNHMSLHPDQALHAHTAQGLCQCSPALPCLQVHTEQELQKILPIAKKHGVPVTFRAAGTSLSGQAITDSVLLKLSHAGKNFRNYKVHVRVLIIAYFGPLSIKSLNLIQ